MQFIIDNWLLILLIVVVAVAVILWMRRRGAASAAKEMTSTASNMASSASNAAKSTASSASNMASGAAAGAASMTKDAASSAGSMVKDAGNSATGAMGAAAGAAAGAMGNMDLGQMSDMLGGIMNGNMKMDANSPLGQMVMPMADSITTKLGIPKEIGALVVTFALAKLMEMMKAKSAGSGAKPIPGSTMSSDEVLGKINSGAGIDSGSLKSMGLSSELAKKTGLSEEQATKGLEMALGELSAGLSGKTSYDGVQLPDMSMLKGLMK
jgi:hypothetical protein